MNMFYLIQLTTILMGNSREINESFTDWSLDARYKKENSWVEISWTKSGKEARFFVLQQSTDGMSWKNLIMQTVTDFNYDQRFLIRHRFPPAGKNFYRLKVLSAGEQVSYSVAREVYIPNTLGDWSAYPLPVTDRLTLQYRGSQRIPGVIHLFVQNAAGRTVIQMRCASINTTVPVDVSGLARGIYSVNIVINDELVWESRFIK